MATYYFNVRDVTGLIRDTEGAELPDLDAVREEAQASAREILAESLKGGTSLNHRSFEVADESGATVLVYPFHDAMKAA